MLEIEAGSLTTKRTREAIATARQSWPDALLFVVGPFSPGDRKSAAAAEAAAATENVTFLDPVALGWRPDATTATLSADDLTVVADKLRDLLAP